MPAIIARLIFSLAVIASSPGIYSIVLIGLIESNKGIGRVSNFLIATLVTVFLITPAWIGLWFDKVRWTKQRITMTTIVWIVHTMLGLFFSYQLAEIGPYDVLFTIMCGIGVMLSWFALTPLIWKETWKERIKRLRSLATDQIPCPACGYNMIGLRKAECPECGAAYSLDQLFAAVHESQKSLGEST